MNLFKRAITSIKRTPIKSSILFLLILLLGSLTIGAVAVRNAVQATEGNLRQNMLPIVLIEESDEIANVTLDDERWLERGSLTPEIVYEIGALPYVDYFDYRMNSQVYSYDVRPWYPHADLEEELSNVGMLHYTPAGYGLTVSGVSHPDFIDKRLGLLEITSGNTFTEAQLRDGGYVAVVSTLWARQNYLEVGDIFELKNAIFDWPTAHTQEIVAYESYEFEIIGLFDIEMPAGFNLPVNEWEPEEGHAFWQLNSIYIPNTIVRRINHSNQIMQAEIFDFELETFCYWLALRPIVFTLHDPLYFEAFSDAVLPMLPGFFEPYAYSNRFEAIASSMSLMLDIADTVLIGAVVASIIIIGLTIVLFLYDRRQEIGIYLALGEKRVVIIGQLLTEISIIAVVAILLSVFVGNAIASFMSQTILENELSHIVFDDRSIFDEVDHFESLVGLAPPLSGEEMIELFDISLSAQNVIVYMIVGITVTLISVIIPLIYVLRLEPKEILL